jgi:CPA2 family monovalent cation:H+ antiporter-2
MAQSDPIPAPGKRHVVVAGYGPVGRAVTERLRQEGFDVVIIELNLATIARQLAMEQRVVYGDVTDPEVLDKAGIRDADALILAVPDEDVAARACGVARKMNQHIYIAARTNFLSKGLLASQLGADHVVVEEVVTAEAMKEAVVARLCGNDPKPARG